MKRIAERLLRIRHRMLLHATTGVVAAVLLLAVTALLAAACSSDGPAPEAAESGQRSDALGEWAIHVYAGEPGAAVRVDLPPPRVVGGSVTTSPYARPGVADSDGEATANLDEQTGPGAPGLSPMAVVDTPDGGQEVDQYDETAPSVDPRSWLLVWGAAMQCGLGERTSPRFVPHFS